MFGPMESGRWTDEDDGCSGDGIRTDEMLDDRILESTEKYFYTYLVFIFLLFSLTGLIMDERMNE